MWHDSGPAAADGASQDLRPEETLQSLARLAGEPVTSDAGSLPSWILPPGLAFPADAFTQSPLAPASRLASNCTYVCQNNIIVLKPEDGHNFYST